MRKIVADRNQEDREKINYLGFRQSIQVWPQVYFIVQQNRKGGRAVGRVLLSRNERCAHGWTCLCVLSVKNHMMDLVDWEQMKEKAQYLFLVRLS